MPFVIDSREAGVPYQQKFDPDTRTDGQPVYVGWADPGEATSEARWRIYKITYAADDSVSAIQYASGSIRFDQIWDNRASLSYS